MTEDFSGFAFLNGSDPGILRLPQGDYTFVFQPTSGSGSRPFRTAAVTLDENTHRIDLDFQDLPVASD
ncbi:MAG: hypothetical protein M5R36_02900 [Deltaproteobacteria bacterium]|nr:hypothetical protein [Deltaproteobacteria bacterium]